MNIQKTTKIALLTTLIALTGAQCWGAAETGETYEQKTQRINDENLAKVFRGEVPEIPDDVFIEHLLGRMSAAVLMNMAVARPELYPFIKTIPQFIQLQQNLQAGLQRYNGNLQEIFFEMVRISRVNQAAFDVVDYLAQFVNINEKNNQGDTALIIATRTPNPNMVKMLLEKGADIYATDNAGETVLNIAERNLAGLVRAVNPAIPGDRNRAFLSLVDDARTIVNLLTMGG